MAAAKVAEMNGRGVITVSSSVGLILSDAGGSFSTHMACEEVVAAAADARRENRTSRKRGEGKSDGGGEFWVVQVGGEKSAQCEIAPSVNTSECRQCGCCVKRSRVVAAAPAACCTEGLCGAGRLFGSFAAKNPAFHLASVAFLIWSKVSFGSIS